MKANLLRFGNIVTYAITIIVNSLAGSTALLNGRTTAAVSDAYPTLVTPAGYVFSIWGVIYLLLLAFVIYQVLPGQKYKSYQKQISVLFILSGLFNVVWLFLWQYDYIVLSVVVMFALLATLITIYVRLGIGKTKAPLMESLLVRLPFSVYLGWITIATIANVSAALVSVSWDGLGLSPQTWAILVLAVAAVIAVTVIVTRKDIAYSLVLIWALAGIAVKQSLYPDIVLTAQIVIVVIVVVLAVRLFMYKLRR